MPKIIALTTRGDKLYYFVNLWIDGRNQGQRVHRLVLDAFVGPEPELDGLHRDNNGFNNHLSNLRWGTKLDNMADKKIHGTEVLGSQRHAAKLNEKQAREIKDALARGERSIDLARMYEVRPQTIGGIKKGIAWRHV